MLFLMTSTPWTTRRNVNFPGKLTVCRTQRFGWLLNVSFKRCFFVWGIKGQAIFQLLEKLGLNNYDSCLVSPKYMKHCVLFDTSFDVSGPSEFPDA